MLRRNETEERWFETSLQAGDPPDPQLRGVLAEMRAAGVGPVHAVGVAAGRERVAASRRAGTPGPPVEAVEDVLVPGAGHDVPVRVYRPAGGTGDGVVVYAHGGGWVLGGIEESDALCRTVADVSGCDVVNVGYRLAPEHPYPAAADDTEAVARWAAAQEPSRALVLMGDSAGGNLVAVAARRLRDGGGPRAVLQVLVYPVTDHRMTTDSYRTHAAPLLIGGEDMRWFWDHYAPASVDRSGPDLSPGLVGDLAGLPPALVVVADYDPLRDEALTYARRLADAGVPVDVERYPSMAHGFFTMLGVLDAAGEAVASVAHAVRDAVGVARAARSRAAAD